MYFGTKSFRHGPHSLARASSTVPSLISFAHAKMALYRNSCGQAPRRVRWEGRGIRPPNRPVVRNNASQPEIGLPGRIPAGL
jgi:hypothetical protein